MAAGVKKENRSKNSLIFALNQAINGNELPDAKVITSHFDVSTGTMYCENDESFDRAMIKEAQAYFKIIGVGMRKSTNPETIKKGEFCKIAEEAIAIMLKNDFVKTE